MANEQMDNFEDLEELHTNELDDIVLEKYEKKNKIKRYLLISGSLLLIFLIVLSIVKMISDSSSAPQESLVETQEVPTQQEQLSEPSNMQEVPIIEEDTIKKEESEISQVINEVMKKEKEIAATNQNEPPQRKIIPSHPVEKKVQTKPVVKPKKVAKETKKALTKTPPKHTKKTQQVVKTGSYYIQVGAFLKYYPDKAFLKKIKKAGFNYIIKEVISNGKKIRRVYIGPFQSRKEASKYLGKVRSKISKNAFITRIR
ncbi:DedD protein [Nitratiruptor sp. YY08-26]|uniref:SPOR domain-containing protein n=1 Tax=unclassified Nitratiruptor TaxID=2624044 RepID=UPI0019158ADF|nr:MULTISPECIES: SPOR domain-containing protein [unclassified Nitratiruptor]BCD61930.1 DedD protein [Nitratiruptor sp. YY08-13]BCD65865.1 DedD protein [Nitratiruptor sp. YY08-26]